MCKYKYKAGGHQLITLNQIANELAESNRLKRIEIKYYIMANGGIDNFKESESIWLDDKA